MIENEKQFLVLITSINGIYSHAWSQEEKNFEIKHQYIQLPVGLRYNLYPTYILRTDDISYFVCFGYKKMNKMNLKLKYYIDRGLTDNSPFFANSYNSLALILSYAFF